MKDVISGEAAVVVITDRIRWSGPLYVFSCDRAALLPGRTKHRVLASSLEP